MKKALIAAAAGLCMLFSLGMVSCGSTASAPKTDTAPAPAEDSGDSLMESIPAEGNTDGSSAAESSFESASVIAPVSPPAVSAAATESGGSAEESRQESAGMDNLLCDEKQLYTYDDMLADIQTLQAACPAELHSGSLGTTADGRELMQLVIGDENAANQILIFASIHAREYITTQLCMKQCRDFLKQLADGSGSYQGVSYQDLLSGAAIHFLPMVNPDGVTISQLGPSALNSAAVRANVEKIAAMEGGGSDSYFRRWKSNAEGIDLNRNFDAKWEEYNDNVGHPSADHYKGESPVCTEESKILYDLTQKCGFKRTINYHTQGGVIYWYFEQEGELLNTSKTFAEEIASVTGYPLDDNYQNLDPAGYKDWAISKMGIPSLTIEVGSGEDPVDPSELSGICDRNREVWPAALYNMATGK